VLPCPFYLKKCVGLSAAGELVVLGEALGFCGGEGGVSCCDSADDAGLRAELEGMRISDATCAAIVKAFLCTVIKCASILLVLDGDSGPLITHHRFTPSLSLFFLFFFFFFLVFAICCVCWHQMNNRMMDTVYTYMRLSADHSPHRTNKKQHMQ